MIKPPDYLTFTRNGVTHLGIEQAYATRVRRMLRNAYRQGMMSKYVLLFLLLIAPAVAREDDWSRSDAMIREWFSELKQPDNPYMSCCGEADAFESDIFTQTADGNYEAVITNGKGVIPNGVHVIIPDAKIKWDRGNPTGHGWVFLSSAGEVYCYITPAGA